ncbi:MAG: FkbM family methyltransferase [Alphaproteobacteria bacterium]|nr:FkbM family methyltransferase [Alphaproteobacteria bacterium SS10]
MLELTSPLLICDIGAALHGEKATWHHMVESGCATVIGFEPEEKAFAELQKLGDGYEILPYVIADGKPGTFHLNHFAETSSLLPTNRDFVKRYQALPDLMTTKSRSPCETKTLDDALGDRKLDLLKVDVQGMTLPLLEHAPKVLASYPLIECEVEFQPLYKDQALFAEVDQFMRSQGYMLLKLQPPKPIYFEPKTFADGNNPRLGQTAWSDAIYVADHDKIDELDQQQLERLVVLSLLWYGCYDFACSLMYRIDRRFGTDKLLRFGEAMRDGTPLSITIGDVTLTLPSFWENMEVPG